MSVLRSGGFGGVSPEPPVTETFYWELEDATGFFLTESGDYILLEIA